jgi:hypothetical protein
LEVPGESEECSIKRVVEVARERKSLASNTWWSIPSIAVPKEVPKRKRQR